MVVALAVVFADDSHSHTLSLLLLFYHMLYTHICNAQQQVQNGINTAKSATSDLRDPNVDASIQTPKVGGFFGTNSREQAQQVAQKTGDKVCNCQFRNCQSCNCHCVTV
jgi:hypothetical protein